MDGVQVVVDRDAAYTHHLTDRFDRLAEQEGAPLIEDPHGGLLLLATEFGQWRSDLLLDCGASYTARDSMKCVGCV